MGKVMKKGKTMKAKRVSKIATGKLARAMVLRGTKERTAGGLRKEELTRNKEGRIVSKNRSAKAKRIYAATVKPWNQALQAARKALGVTGFVAVGGKTAQGKALYAKAKALYKQ